MSMPRSRWLLLACWLGWVTAKSEPNEEITIQFNVANLDGLPAEDSFLVKAERRLAPRGYDRFKELIQSGYYEGAPFFRVVPRFVVQFGIAADPQLTSEWRVKGPIKDDPLIIKNTGGTLTFATSGKDTRGTQLFINLRDNHHLDEDFTPFAEILGDGMHVVNRIFNGYGEEPDQGKLNREGKAYFEKEFPRISVIASTKIVSEESSGKIHVSSTEAISSQDGVFESALLADLEGALPDDAETLKVENANLREEVDKVRRERNQHERATSAERREKQGVETELRDAVTALSTAKGELANLKADLKRISDTHGQAAEAAGSLKERLTLLQTEKAELENDYKTARSYFVSQIEKLQNTIRDLEDQVTKRDLYISRVMHLLIVVVVAGAFFAMYRMYCGTSTGDKDCDV